MKSPDGEIHAVWTDGRAGEGTQFLDIFYASSSDGGLSFGPNLRVNDDSAAIPPVDHPHFTRGAQGTPSIVVDSGSGVHVVWEDFRNYVQFDGYCRDVYYASMEGAAFTGNVRVNSVTPGAESVNCADPNVAIDDQDNLFIAYADAPSLDCPYEIYYVFAPGGQAASDDGLNVTVDWDRDHYYPGDQARFNTTVTSRAADPLRVNRFEVRFEWQGEGYCYSLYGDEPVNFTAEGDSRADQWEIYIPSDAEVGDISYHTSVYYDEYVGGEWVAHGYLRSDAGNIEVHSVHERTCHESHDGIYAQISSLRDLDPVDSDAIASLELAEQELGLAATCLEEGSFEEAVDHLLWAEGYAVEAERCERDHWRVSSEEVISRVELGLEGIGDLSDPRSLDLYDQTSEKMLEAESFFDEGTIQGYRGASTSAMEAESLLGQLLASIESEADQEPEPEPEPEEEPRGIPGFPSEAMILGVLGSALVLSLMGRRVYSQGHVPCNASVTRNRR